MDQGERMNREPTEKELHQAADLFKALSHPDRLLVACRLAKGPGSTQKELVEALGWPQSTVARHVGALRDRGLVAGTREGVEVRLEATSLPRLLLDGICEWLRQAPRDEEGTPAMTGR
jgi:DNA-binding transcriptional ArsR family regulator